MSCRVTEFCCGCSLRHGAITAAIIKIIVAVLMIALGAQLVSDSVDDRISLFEEIQSTSSELEITYLGKTLLVLGFIHGWVAVCLIVGIIKNVAGFVLPWLILCMINIIATSILIVIEISAGIYFAIAQSIIIAFYIYLWIVVYSYFEELKGGYGRFYTVV